MTRWLVMTAVVMTAAAAMVLSTRDAASTKNAERSWLAGDSHIHSHWSPSYDQKKTPPGPIRAGDAHYATPENARMARTHGLAWMVTTDHGGPNHAKFNMVHAYPELLESRRLVPEVLQFYGMELNMPGMDHHTLIIPNSQEERSVLFDIEHQFDANEAWPADPLRNTEAARLRALAFMARLPRLPILFANHPSRSATGVGIYGLDEPHELRTNHDLAPEVYRGMEGAPGHQAGTLAQDGGTRRGEDGQPAGFRGGYRNPGAHTIGGFDQMTARVGGLWDALLGEGRRFWIVATSDSHVHYRDPKRGGSDFWPGEYQKTYVHAVRSYDGVLDGLRSGRIFAVAGDLITELEMIAAAGKSASADIGGTLKVQRGDRVTVTVRFKDPRAQNAGGRDPNVARVDLIVGDVHGASTDRNNDRNATTKVLARFDERHWSKAGDVYSMNTTLPAIDRNMYLRVRGTNTTELEPTMDAPGEDPWSDLWFYSNPTFIEVGER